jgi:glycosyltransferase involved in cell wall biosynthesis
LFEFSNLNGASALHYTTRKEMEQARFLKLRAPEIVVPNGIEWDSFAKLSPRGRFRVRLGIPSGTPVVLFAGRVNFIKGLDLLVPAFTEIARTVPEAVLVIAGPDNEGYGRMVRSWVLEDGLSERVYLTGVLNQEELREAYVDADVFVLPSYSESFGMSVIEAMACGCPVVVSDRVGISRDIREARAGLVVPLDRAALADAIKSLLCDRIEARSMGVAGRAHVENHYAWNLVVGRLTRVYEALVRREPLSAVANLWP